MYDPYTPSNIVGSESVYVVFGYSENYQIRVPEYRRYTAYGFMRADRRRTSPEFRLMRVSDKYQKSYKSPALTLGWRQGHVSGLISSCILPCLLRLFSMSDSDTDEYDFSFGKPVDDDYVHPEEGERAELSVDTHERETAAQGKFWTSENTGVAMSTDARSGSGADTDALIDAEAIQENDGRSTSATFFYTGGKSFSEPVADSGPNYSMDRAERLAKYNDDWRINAKNYSRTTENMTVFRQKFVRLVCEELGMTTNQEERVFETVESINMKHMACYNTEQVVLSVATLVADEDAIQHAMATDSDDLRWIREEEECRSLMDDLLLEPGDVRKCRKLIKDKGSQDWRNT